MAPRLPPLLFQVWTTLSVAVPISPTMAAGPEAAHAARLLGRWAHPLAGTDSELVRRGRVCDAVR